ncbi:NADH-quinone oxidoreductase subunit NuoH [Elizabethkingia meningoseptica]|uniref:NADH-quinone oxidoreductase subunit H n=1 Tax=Elizabethkingia meningoseptica TaxID=238 RepID=A0A1V3U564_ELIME|nr:MULTISPECIES: NADH-quinone oxidoreductase subunit NuoH [Elizabethkingia]AQX06914.1 NADH-quinone oxidoreductase subunit H [Elizabethkingia meningoseptica]AQX11160.1 NADH-quinone oxidoreductase subunit H [Elizabethkingia meningoseptica]AQX48960.1 NADH:ubiquinone oxidoreductase subunit H [Elizabethkingia meningoseptica]EJK5329943.1 NADH-quinone oxidoreductase subunit NuoH [Elizabethkingia meningoseptica]EOR29836.1 NADH:ubiquinone oxidoreductase subunit 1 (chain H) [Elizabethkingia meningosepti
MTNILFTTILIVVLFVLCIAVAAYSTWAERKVAAIMQDRIGPNRAGPFGLLQPLADGGKLFFKEEFIPKNAEKFLFILAPGILMFISLLTGAVIPWGKTLNIGGESLPVQVANIDVGVLFLIGMASTSVYAIMIGGWASNNKFSLISAVRASSQMISYELAMGLSLLSIVIMNDSLDLRVITENQAGWGGMKWNVVLQPVAFLIFFVCALAECNRAPFDLAECESELINGFHTEYSSMKFGLFLFAEYVNMFISSALIATLFFGGYNYPGIQWVGENWGENAAGIISIIVFLLKAFTFVFIFMWIRWTLPRFRYDQLMHLGWKSFIPLALINLLVTGAILLFV